MQTNAQSRGESRGEAGEGFTTEQGDSDLFSVGWIQILSTQINLSNRTEPNAGFKFIPHSENLFITYTTNCLKRRLEVNIHRFMVWV